MEMKGQKKKKNFDLLIYAEMRPKQRVAHMLFEFFFHDMEIICGHVKGFLSKKKFSSLATLNINISKSDTLMYNLTSLKISDEGYDSYYALNPKGP